MNSHAAVTFSCAARTLLLFMILFGVSCPGLIRGTGGVNSSRRDACNFYFFLGGEEMLPLPLWFGGQGREVGESLSLQGSALLHHLRPAGATLALVRVTWVSGGG